MKKKLKKILIILAILIVLGAILVLGINVYVKASTKNQIIVYSIENYKTIINERARKGWRYVGYIPTKQRGTGHIQELELIFEKSV